MSNKNYPGSLIVFSSSSLVGSCVSVGNAFYTILKTRKSKYGAIQVGWLNKEMQGENTNLSQDFLLKLKMIS